MTLVDSSAWLEFLIGSPLAEKIAPYMDAKLIITPAIVLYEVYKKIRRDHSEEMAEFVLAQLERTKVIPLDGRLALKAAHLSLEYFLPMADAIIYATALSFQAQVLTCDKHFQGLPGVIYLTKDEPILKEE